MNRKASLLWSVLAVITLLLSACNGGNSPSSSNDNGEYNAKKQAVELVAPADPGSGWDTTARAIAQTLEKEKLINFPLQVLNEPGATGAVSLSQLVTQHKGDDLKLSITSTPILSNYYYGNSEYSYKDVTMIARLITEYYVIVVPTDSPFQTLDDLLQAINDDPANIALGAAGDDRLPFALIVHESGGDAKKVKFIDYPNGGGDIANALLNGDLDAGISGVSEFRGQIEAGNFRALAVTSKERLKGSVSEIPTVIEQGIDVEFGNWRAIMGPPGMSETAIKYWEDIIKTTLESETFQQFAENNQWDITYLVGDEFQEYLKQSDSDIKTGLEITGQIE
ncbi:tripartite tricarboxylate transporter substrate-binding protein [Caldibacillus lycopersici]|uniref:Tripartite tricarboxylate transporter substrate-binding protein n=1 Tax=Perspicuibacillus lycopersici TaxID=1325689 RepID=A0AAE3IV65_9BACI|nr:tripartite tricarboxylate transporter substrate-binding protein [Perspicuibacillus lycopersici]MCU9612645.1 tripartite tricarboxylate transporter substrate-binding protein [Perspicuibacillus lycopersici]